MTSENVIVQVRESTQVEQFLPFTALPARYKGQLVELVIIDTSDVDIHPDSPGDDLFP
jgi:hypothetical protein